MQRCHVSRYAVGLGFSAVPLILPQPLIISFALPITARTRCGTMRAFLTVVGNSRTRRPPGLAIAPLILKGLEFDPNGSQALFDLGQMAQPSAAELDLPASHQTAFGVKR